MIATPQPNFPDATREELEQWLMERNEQNARMASLLESFCCEQPPIDPVNGRRMTFKQWVRMYSGRTLKRNA